MMLAGAQNNFNGTSRFEITGRTMAFYGYGAMATAVGKLASWLRGSTSAAEIKALVGDKHMKQVISTKKKMGAQTIEANNNAGVAAANQIVGFFEKGDMQFQLKA